MRAEQIPNSANRTATWLADSIILFALVAVLIGPLFFLNYMDNWQSIESTFIADARFLVENWPHPQWQPLWYGGTRFDYIYPPALRYGTAAISRFLALNPARAYHLYTAFFYCLGIVAVYWFTRIGSRSRVGGWLAAVLTALVSPVFVFVPILRYDSPVWMPQRLHVLLAYGEGPHMTALALLPLALAAAYLALQETRPAMMALAALFSALVVSNNFYGATALAILFPILAWAVWVTHRDNWLWLRAALIALLAYGLVAFWLTPSYLRITVRNMKHVSQPGNLWSVLTAIAAVGAYCYLSWRFAHRRPKSAWQVFVSGASLLFTINVLGLFYFNFRVFGEPIRLVPELDLVMILLFVEVVRWLWSRPGVAREAIAILLVLVPLVSARRYIWHAWEHYPEDRNPERRVEHRIPEWLWKNLPHSRSFVTGSVRFWFNAWHDLAQVDGGSLQGMLNEIGVPVYYQMCVGEKAEPGVQWMQALGADTIIVHDASSQEHYHDYRHPGRFSGLLPVLFDDQQGNRIYQVPRRFPGLARVVDTSRFRALRPIAEIHDSVNLRAYVEAIENGPDSAASFQWEGPEAMRVRARTEPGQSLLIQVSYDPYWRAYSGNQLLQIQPDLLGFQWIQVPPGEHDIRLVFEVPLENQIGRIVSVMSGLAALTLIGLGLRRSNISPT
jgi:hypothetical protein